MIWQERELAYTGIKKALIDRLIGYERDGGGKQSGGQGAALPLEDEVIREVRTYMLPLKSHHVT